MDDSPEAHRLDIVGRLDPSAIADVRGVVEEATIVDGVRPLSEHVSLHLRYGGEDAARNLLARLPSGQLAGYLHLDVTDAVEGPSAEIVVRPTQRGHGYGSALVAEALRLTDGRLRLWAHGDLPVADAMARRLGFRRVRVLWQLRRTLDDALPAHPLPDGVSVRTFVPGADDDAWLALNARAFADHPEQGSWQLIDLRRRISESWFDPAGFFLAERAGGLVGFHWTKVHGGRPGLAGAHAHEPIGEVYVLGVDPGAQGLGLGRALTAVGLQHLRDLGLHQVMLYVEESNAAAMRVYESLSFRRWATDVLYRHS